MEARGIVRRRAADHSHRSGRCDGIEAGHSDEMDRTVRRRRARGRWSVAPQSVPRAISWTCLWPNSTGCSRSTSAAPSSPARRRLGGCAGAGGGRIVVITSVAAEQGWARRNGLLRHQGRPALAGPGHGDRAGAVRHPGRTRSSPGIVEHRSASHGPHPRRRRRCTATISSARPWAGSTRPRRWPRRSCSSPRAEGHHRPDAAGRQRLPRRRTRLFRPGAAEARRG